MSCKNSRKGSKKESRFSLKGVIEHKEELDDIVVKGYIATTHFDGQDKITEPALIKWAKEINEGNPRANKVSIHHEREPHVAGVGLKGSAKVEQLPDGEYGLFVETLVNKTKENFDETKYQIEKDILDSYSIEYVAPEDAKIDESGARILDEDTELFGWTLASQPMNEHAVMIKELINQKKQIKEETKMPEEEIKKDDVPVQPDAAPAEEPKKDEEAPKEEVVDEKVDEKELKEFRDYKKAKAKTEKKEETKDLVDSIVNGVKEEVEKLKVEKKTMINNDKNIEGKEADKKVIQFKEAFEVDSKLSISSKASLAGKMADECGLTDKGFDAMPITKSAESRVGSYKFEVKTDGCKNVLEYKGLGITTNQNTDTDYLLSAAELSDVFEPFIFNMLNEETVTWNVLRKVDRSNKGNNQQQFTGKTVANTTAAAYTGNAINTGVTKRLKFMTKFKKYQAGIEVDGDMIAAAAGGPVGDVFAQEVMDATETLMSVMNQALYAEVGAETAAGVIGFEYITDSAGNTTLYSLTRDSSTNLLAPDSAGDTYINGASADLSLTNMRAAKRQCLKDGSKIENLVYFTDHIQGDKFRGIYDSAQRTVPTSSRFGFEGRPEFDGIPLFEDKDCNDDDVFLVDLEAHQIAIWVPPTLERLGKDSDSEKGFIKTYWCTFNRAPRRMVQIYGNATS